jgi:hypothetical protein
MQLAFGKTRKGTAVLKLQELREKLDALAVDGRVG